jgi:DUF1009 family protein
MIALIAGQGVLPPAIAAALKAQGTAWRALALEGFAPEGLADVQTFAIENLGRVIADLRAEGVTQVCFAGRIARPPVDATRIDAATMPLVPRMMQALQAGDDAALRTVLAFFEEAGIAPVAAHAIAPDLLPDCGILVGRITDQDRADVIRARAVHTAMSAADVGQGLVVARGQVLAVEALPGTDWMLETLALPQASAASPVTPAPRKDPHDPFEWAFGGVADWLGGQGAPKPAPSAPARGAPFPRPAGGVFFKAPKPGQDRRIDLPVIGPHTFDLVADAGLNAVVIEAGGVMMLEAPLCLQRAAARGVALWVCPRPAPDPQP